MNRQKIIFPFLLLFIMFTSCGYQKIYKSDTNSYFLNNIKVIGDKRIGYNLKNEIVLNSSSNSINKIDIRLDINKRKETKEKNISNKITKFSILISVNLFLKNNENDKEINKTFNKSVDYDVVSNHSDTISNEENSTQILTDQIGRDIVNFLNLYFIN
jgi:hypothetical protein